MKRATRLTASLYSADRCSHDNYSHERQATDGDEDQGRHGHGHAGGSVVSISMAWLPLSARCGPGDAMRTTQNSSESVSGVQLYSSIIRSTIDTDLMKEKENLHMTYEELKAKYEVCRLCGRTCRPFLVFNRQSVTLCRIPDCSTTLLLAQRSYCRTTRHFRVP
jgi:hypothetical protein